jgi:hypothetical protein
VDGGGDDGATGGGAAGPRDATIGGGTEDGTTLRAGVPAIGLDGPGIVNGAEGSGAPGVAAVPRAAGIVDAVGRAGGAAARGAGVGGDDGASIAIRIDSPPNPIPTARTPYSSSDRIGTPRVAGRRG